MAFLRLGLRAEKSDSASEGSGIHLLDRPSLRHQFTIRFLVLHPITGPAIGGADFCAGGEDRLILVGDCADSIQEIGEVGILRKARKLPDTVLPDVDHLLNLRFLQESKKFLSGFLGETNRKDR